jgi:hypothetical protein
LLLSASNAKLQNVLPKTSNQKRIGGKKKAAVKASKQNQSNQPSLVLRQT